MAPFCWDYHGGVNGSQSMISNEKIFGQKQIPMVKTNQRSCKEEGMEIKRCRKINMTCLKCVSVLENLLYVKHIERFIYA